MPHRRLPQTDDKRSQALAACAARTLSTPPAQWLITVAQNNTLQAVLSPWRNVRSTAATALQVQTTATAAVETAFAACAMVISHFIQVLKFAIARGVLPASDRAYYPLPVGHAEVPVINTSAAALLWVQKLEDGENARISAGGVALDWPAVGEVSAAGAALTNAENAQALAKNACDQLQEAIAEQRPTVDALILDLWDTIEYNLRHNDAPSLRRKAREWGVVYLNDDGTEETDDPPVP